MTAIPAPEYSHAIPMSEIGGKPVDYQLHADADQRAALAERFDLLSLDRLVATVQLHRDGEDYQVKGRLEAEVVQACVVTDAPVSAHIIEDFTVRFIAERDFSPDSEIELSESDGDTQFHDGRMIDLGEAVAQTLGLAINPFPRSPEAGVALKAAGVLGEGEAGPFAALAALRKISG
jgi:uncharacterized metal-binding protein YceD (DUF177 family)